MNLLRDKLDDPQALFADMERFPVPTSVTALLRATAAAIPDQIALRFIEDETAITYAELVDLTARIAGGFRTMGLGPDSRVAIMLDNVPAYPLAYLAIAQIGGSVVPVNTALTVRELVYVLRDSGAEAIIVSQNLLTRVDDALAELPGFERDRIVVIDADVPGRQSWSNICASTPSMADDGHADRLVTIQYTSGTTGFPKGALLPQDFWLRLGISQHAELKLLDVKNVLIVHSWFYMDPFWETVMTFFLGGTAVIAPRLSASRFMPWVRDYDIHYALVTTHIFKQPASELDSQNSLKLLQTYGWTKEVHADFERRFKVPVREVYGMTEIGAGFFTPVAATDTVGTGTVGIPAPYRRVRIVDADDRDVVDGEAGELLVSGPGMFAGYNNLPEVTAQTLQAGWFRTGDIFRRDADGYFYVVGRIKDMIRRNMENIAAGEVEDVLRGYAPIQEAAVLGVPDVEKNEEVVALIVLAPGYSVETVTPEMVLEHCRARLAKFKLPRFIGFREALPLTPSAKVAKGEIRKAGGDLRTDTFDTNEMRWLDLAH